ncbi:Nudix hydrolase YfcD [Seminavis robusta]|uniref:Nudix hydrolase YfcD n=1 Tax=Seminavis robusta TaxID=568900 RepID=A0A9N8EB95_9STRA|nr:Nudix hydrolase YfcD [Seminavis robusta]|eukprot:Sro700_g189670.1 Nudix hydrolase YfcD (479) ;mRNA; f:35688-37124
MSMSTKLTELLLFSVSAAAYVALTKSTRSPTGSNSLIQSLQEGTSLNAKERVCTVNANNEPTSTGHYRNEMRLQKLWHRATYILVLVCDKEDNQKKQKQHVIVQKRSAIKDYCPRKLDPTPGGVVGFGETNWHNATRELEEELGITIGKESDATLTRLFTFPYQDEHVKVFGEFYECIYRGDPHSDLTLQPEEVESIEIVPLEQLRQRIQTAPHEFMPDACHAMQLYFQRTQDATLQRRLLKGYSSGDLDHYRLRPKPKVIFFDCDDCLYFDHWKVAGMLTKKIEEWCITKAKLQPGQAYQLYKQYGTALKGLLEEGYLENTKEAIDRYLQEVHDIGVEQHIARDDKLRDMIIRMDPTIPRYIFTASVREHAQRCLRALGIDDLFDGIIDVKDCQLETKHARQSFECAMAIAGVQEPEACLFVDDSLKNIHTAREMKWRSVLVGKVGRDCGTTITSEHAEQEIDRIHEFPTVWPELFL